MQAHLFQTMSEEDMELLRANEVTSSLEAQIRPNNIQELTMETCLIDHLPQGVKVQGSLKPNMC